MIDQEQLRSYHRSQVLYALQEPPEHRGGFIVWPRWDVPTGDPAQRGSQVDPTGNDPTGWLEFAGSRVVTRYWRRWDVVDQIQGARYESYNRPDLYPEGLYFFGNIDWKDGEDLALSFYGFCSRYVHDVALLDIGARWVLQQGQALTRSWKSWAAGTTGS